MRTKVAWLFVWTTLTFWLGCGENQNYRINQEEAPLLEPVEPAQSDATPSLRGADRSHWAKQEVAPVRGTVPHYPRYFQREWFGRELTWSPDRPSPLFANDPDLEKGYAAAHADDDYHMNAGYLGDALISPLKFTFDVATTPFRAALTERPWSVQTSPQELSPKAQ